MAQQEFVVSADASTQGTRQLLFSTYIGKENREEIQNTKYLITNFQPGRSYNLTTSVYNRGEALVFEKLETFWPTSNISHITTFTTDDFESNIQFSVEVGSSNVAFDLLQLSYTGDIYFEFFYENTTEDTYIRTPNIGPFSKSVRPTYVDTTIWTIYPEYTNNKVLDVFYSVIVDGLYVVSHKPIPGI
jgi:hypothetical protein